MGQLPLLLGLLFTAIPLGTADLPLLRYVSQSVRAHTGSWSHEAQGLAHDDDAWFVTQRHQVWRFPVDHDLREDDPTARRAPIPTALRRRGYDHFGDPGVWGDRLLIPLEGRHRPPLMVVLATHDLEYLGEYMLPRQRKAPWLTVSGDTLYSSNSSVHRRSPIRRYRLSLDDSGALRLKTLAPLRLTTRIRRVQGGVIHPVTGHLVLVSDHDQGGLVVVDLESGEVLGRQPIDVRRGFPFYEELEGATWWDLDGRSTRARGQLHVVMLDNELWTDAVYLKHFR